LYSYHISVYPEIKIENKKLLQQLVGSVESELARDFGDNFIARGWYLWSIIESAPSITYKAFLTKKEKNVPKDQERTYFDLSLQFDHSFDFRENHMSFDGTQNPFT